MKELKAEINLLENALYIVADGRLTKIQPNEFGNDEIIWKNGKVIDIRRESRIRIQGQEVI